MNIEIEKKPPITLLAIDLRDTKGAAKFLASRLKKEEISVDTVHLLVRNNKLRAFVFNENGELIERDARHSRRSGQGLYFWIVDLLQAELPREAPGRPKKERNEQISSSSKKSKKTA